MKDIKILVIVIVIVGVLYWGVEPLAHSIFHPQKANADFAFNDLEKIDLTKGDAAHGEELVMNNCIACHNLSFKGHDVGEVKFPSANGGMVAAPDLSTAGVIYDENFLAAMIKDPVKAVNLAHKFNDENPYIMPQYLAMENAEQEVADIVTFFKSIGEEALKQRVQNSEEFKAAQNLDEHAKMVLEKNLTNKIIFKDACSRCHTIKYDEPNTIEQREANASKVSEIKSYLGSVAPDLSMIIRAKGEHYLKTFINNPQSIAFTDIDKAILNFYTTQKKNEELEALGSNATQAQKEAIAAKGAKDYGISLPANTTRYEWQDEKDYSNLAKKLGVMPVGLSMPRVGLNQESQEKVISYLESIGDAKKQERENLGVLIIAFFGVLSVLAYLWKRKVWKDLH